jgi:biopolymer transport protein ExbD
MSNETESGDFGGDDEARILAKRARAKKASKRKKEEEGGTALNINSMMDIMFLILVFIINSVGDDPLRVKTSPDLVIPRSTSQLIPEDNLQITITRKAIVVGDKQVVPVKDGQVDKSNKRGGENSLYISPLFDRLTEEVSRQKQMATLRRQDFEGVTTVVADRTTPYRLLTEVMYTAGQAQLSKFKFAIVKFGRDAEIKKANQ